MACVSVVAIWIAGCGKIESKQEAKPAKENIIGKTTQNVGEFKAGDAKEADMQVKPDSSPIGAAGGAYGFAVSEIAKLEIKKAIQLFQGFEGRYPKDHEEFMSKVIKANNIKLPVLPGNRQYQYDVENHELKIVEAN